VESLGAGDEASAPIPPPPVEPPPFVGPPAPPASSGSPVGAVPSRGVNWLWYTALAVVVVVTLGGFGLLFIDDQGWQHRSNDLARQNASLHKQVLSAQQDLHDSQQQVAALRGQAQHPELGLWNVQQRIDNPDTYLAGGIPDTFTYHLVASSSGPMNVSILTFEQFASGIECVDSGSGNSNQCMHHSGKGTVMSWLNVTSVTYDFRLAEGCANYMVVFTAPSPVTVTPDVKVTYNPAPTFTGDCVP
jgi:hypothetical protein